jgi:hypothetical protein
MASQPGKAALRLGTDNEVSPTSRSVAMHPFLRQFTRQYLAVVVAALLPVILTAFLTIPFNLGGHPGDVRALDVPATRHMT